MDRNVIFGRIALAILLVGLVVTAFLGEKINNERSASEIRARVQHDFTIVRDRLEGNLNSDLQLVKGLLSVIATNPELSQQQFEKACRPIFQGRTQLRNIGAAPNMVIKLMYPVEGNEKAIGLDYRKTAAQFEAADQAVKLRQIVLAGPLNLTQGGTGLIARLPVFIENSQGKEHFWGLVSAVIDSEYLFKMSGLNDPGLPIEIAVRGKDGRGADGEMFLGRPEIFTANPVLTEIPLPHGSWQLAAIPKGGWPSHAENEWIVRGGFALIALIILGSFLIVVSSLQRVSRARVSAEAANEAKSQFLTTMSHEIRTPLNGILGMAQLLLMDDGIATEQRKNYARVILQAGNTLLTLLNDILDLSKVEAGKLELSLIDFDPLQIANEMSALFAEPAKSKGLKLEVHYHGAMLQHYHADATRLRQMLTNLLSNAIKFTDKGFVRLDISEITRQGSRATLEFVVTDTGIGIPKEQFDKLFQPFVQADSSTTRKYGGTGLGLSIIKRLAALMGGTVGAESNPGSGSRFWFTVQAEALSPDENNRQIEPRAASALVTLPSQSVHIMVAEDNPINQQIIEAMIKKLGLQVTIYDDGEALVTAIKHGIRPALILTDVQMPIMDGLTASRQIRAWELANSQSRLPIIALTAGAFEEDRQLCTEAGMDDFLTKPIDLSLLQEILSKWLNRNAG